MELETMNCEFANCSCGRAHRCSVEAVVIGAGALDSLRELCASYDNILVVSDENTHRVCGEAVLHTLSNRHCRELVLTSREKVVVPDEESIKTIENALDKETALLVGVGSGVINDLCKYVSFFHGLPYYIVATAPSMDGYASVGAAMILNGMKVTVNARPPRAIIGDTAILKNAPLEMLQAGYGDIIGKFSCLNDWKLSALVQDEYFCQRIYDCTLACAEKLRPMADRILSRDEQAVDFLMEALVTVGVLMSYVNSSRPASGSEHHMSHFFEITGILEGKDYFAHGVDVLLSSFYTQKIREELLTMDVPHAYTVVEGEMYMQKLREIYHILAEEVASLQNKVGFYQKNRLECYQSRWEKIKEVLREAPPSAEIERLIRRIGLNLADFEALYGREKIENALWFAKDLKDRYTVLWLYFDLKYQNKQD